MSRCGPSCGIDASERQARRLLNDMAAFRAWLEHKRGRPVSEVVAANRWLEEVYDPVIAAIPADLRSRLQPAEVFSEVLEHRWYMSEAAGRDVGTTAATRDYIKHVLPAAPDPLKGGEPTGPPRIIGPVRRALCETGCECRPFGPALAVGAGRGQQPQRVFA